MPAIPVRGAGGGDRERNAQRLDGTLGERAALQNAQLGWQEVEFLIALLLQRRVERR